MRIHQEKNVAKRRNKQYQDLTFFVNKDFFHLSRACIAFYDGAFFMFRKKSPYEKYNIKKKGKERKKTTLEFLAAESQW